MGSQAFLSALLPITTVDVSTILEPGKEDKQLTTDFKKERGEKLRVNGKAKKNGAHQLLEPRTALKL